MGRAQLRLRPVRVSNCVPIGNRRGVRSVSASFWNVDVPSKLVSLPNVSGDGLGGAVFGEDDLWLPLDDSSTGVVMRAELAITLDQPAAVVKAATSVRLDFARPRSLTPDQRRQALHQFTASPSAHRSPADAGSIWCQLRRSGEAGGEICGELLLRWERHVAPVTSGRKPPQLSSSSLFGRLSRITEESPASKRSGADPPDSFQLDGQRSALRDAQGFELRVPPGVHEEFRAYYWLRCEAQLSVWADKVYDARGAGNTLVDTWLHSLRDGRRAIFTSVAVGIPAALRPELWLVLSGAAELRRAAGLNGSYSILAAAEPAPQSVLPRSWLSRVKVRVGEIYHGCGRTSVCQPVTRVGDGLGLVSAEAIRQIDLDLTRTFPEHDEFKSADGRARLRRVLCAHCARNPSTGYTQSLNFIAAFLLLQLPDVVDGGLSREEAAFWLLEAVTEKLLPGYFSTHLAAVQADTRVLDELLCCHPELGALASALEPLGFELSLVSTQWLMLGFVCALPTETSLRAWDIFITLGPRALFAASLALLHLLKEPLLHAVSFETVYSVLKSLHEPALDCDRFVRLMVSELDALPAERLCAMRAGHLRDVLREQREREASRLQHGRRKPAFLSAASMRRQLRLRVERFRRKPLAILVAFLAIGCLLVADDLLHNFSLAT